jgi:hypothetical protein
MTICFLVTFSLACFCLAFRFLEQLIRERPPSLHKPCGIAKLPPSHRRPALPTNSGGAPESRQIKLQVMEGSGEIVAITASQICCRTSTNPQTLLQLPTLLPHPHPYLSTAHPEKYSFTTARIVPQLVKPENPFQWSVMPAWGRRNRGSATAWMMLTSLTG